MPLPAARFALPHVGAPRDQGSDRATRADAQVRGLLRCGELEHGQVRASHVQCVQCRNLSGIPQKTTTTSFAKQAHGHCAGQRQVPPRHLARPFSAQAPQAALVAIPATLQSAARTHRTRLEARPATRHPQSILRYTRRSARRHQRVLRPLAPAQFCFTKIMLHYLSRYV